jgi:hypothetical protein
LGKLSLVGHPLTAGLRRAIGLALIVGLLISAVVFYRTAPELPRAVPVAESGISSAPAPPPTVAPSTSATTLPDPTATTAPTKTKLPKGPGTTQPGILLMASPLPNGSFDIAELVLLTAPTSSIRLSPPKLTLAGSRFANAQPVASQVQVSAGNQPVVVPGGHVRQPTDLVIAAPAKRIELRYNLSGVTVRSMPSRAGRALAAMSPLVVGVPSSLPVAMMVSGSTVLNIECPVLRLRDRACSIGLPPRLRVKQKLPRNNAVIVVQFDLPRPQ